MAELTIGFIVGFIVGVTLTALLALEYSYKLGTSEDE